MRDYAAVRRATVERLGDWGLGDPAPLPLLSDEDFAWVRPVDQVVARCHAMAGIIGLEQGGDPGDFRAQFEELGLVEHLAARERLFLDAQTGVRDDVDPDALRQAEVDVTWRQESLWALLWALGFVGELPPDQECGDSSAYERLAPDFDPAQTPPGVELRPVDDIVPVLDLYYCLHWHDRDREFGNTGLPPSIQPGVVWERRQALEWLFRDEPWDEIDLST